MTFSVTFPVIMTAIDHVSKSLGQNIFCLFEVPPDPSCNQLHHLTNRAIRFCVKGKFSLFFLLVEKSVSFMTINIYCHPSISLSLLPTYLIFYLLLTSICLYVWVWKSELKAVIDTGQTHTRVSKNANFHVLFFITHDSAWGPTGADDLQQSCHISIGEMCSSCRNYKSLKQYMHQSRANTNRGNKVQVKVCSADSKSTISTGITLQKHGVVFVEIHNQT